MLPQARLCLQGPLQLLLFVCHTWPVLSWTSDTPAFPESLRCCLVSVASHTAQLPQHSSTVSMSV